MVGDCNALLSDPSSNLCISQPVMQWLMHLFTDQKIPGLMPGRIGHFPLLFSFGSSADTAEDCRSIIINSFMINSDLRGSVSGQCVAVCVSPLYL